MHGSLFGALGPVEARKREKPKTLKLHMEIDKLGLFGPSPDASRTSIGVSWRPPGGLESRPKADLGCLG
eukprot:9058372-Pyramimonas_sp.AAC.1